MSSTLPLRDEMRRLREDPAAIEAVARRELGLLRRDELLVVVRPLSRPPSRWRSPGNAQLFPILPGE